MATKTISDTARLKVLYNESIAKDLKNDLNLSNVHQVPKVEKVIVSIGLGKGKDDKRLFEVAENTLLKITGQKPVETLARMSIASFKLREGNRIGLKVTLRGERMYEFLDRLINIVMPRFRDFHGVSDKSFDKSGNYNIGIKEQSVFPELTFEDTAITHGIQITIVMSGGNSEYSKALLEKLGMPFEKKKENK